jgi:cephalosporin hydroxylase
VKHPWADAVQKTYFLGIKTLKNPLDAWVYQEIIFETKPDVIIETGSHLGGSGLYLATLCEIMGKGRVYSIELAEDRHEDCKKVNHPRLTFFQGSSIANYEQMTSLIKPEEKVMVILDSEHLQAHVKAELDIYSKVVTSGQYLIVEDTFWRPEEGGGPGDATDEFLKENKDFERDDTRERFVVTHNPGGFLKKL